MDIQNIAIILSVVTNALLLIVVTLRSPLLKPITYFKIATLFIVLWSISMIFYRIETNQVLLLLWAKFLYGFPTMIPIGYYLFGVSFPDRDISTRHKIFAIAPALLVFLITVFTSGIISSVNYMQNAENVIDFGSLYFLCVIYFNLYFTVIYYIYIRKIRQLKGMYKKQFLYIFIGLILTSGIALFTNSILPSFGDFRFNWVGQIAALFWVVSVSYAMLRHRYLDLQVTLVRYVLFAILTLAVLFPVSATLSFLVLFFAKQEIMLSVLFFHAIVGIGVALLFPFIRSKLEKATEAVLFQGKYDHSAFLSETSNALSTVSDIQQLYNNLSKLFAANVKISGLSLVLEKSSLTKHSYFLSEELDTNQLKEIVESRRVRGMKVVDDFIFTELLEESNLKRRLVELNVQLIFPINKKNERLGYILLQSKQSGEPIYKSEIDLIKIVIHQVSIAVQNALSFEEIKRFNETLESEVKKATHRLRSANERLKQLDKLKDEFVSLASHELRTPMTSIRNYLWMALNQEKGGKLNKKQQFYLQRSYSSTERLINLVNDILNISRIESGRMALQVDKVNMLELAQSAVGEVSAKAEKEKIKIVVEEKALNRETQRESSVPEVVADHDKIDEVLINLVGNSLKFTPAKGTITIHFEYDKQFLYTSVIDTGVGIEANMMDKLFVKFGLIDNSYRGNKDPVQGTGLGLYLSKSLVEMHTGTITVESEGKDKGTTFTFSLPLFSQKVKEEIQSKQKGKPVLAALKRVK